MSRENKIDPFDDLFEPFDLDEDAPTGHEQQQQPQPDDTTNYVSCPSCGTRNPAQNRHCESCGARISQAALPIAPQPAMRTTPGARALGVLAAVILVVAVLALVVNFLRDDGGTTPGDDPSATTLPGDGSATSLTSSTSLPVIDIQPLTPTRVEASSELTGFPASALIDDDPENYWNDESLRGEDAQLRFFFSQPVEIRQIVIENLTEEERFLRNYRIEGIEITTDDLAPSNIVTLDDVMEPQPVDIASVRTTVVTLNVTSTYPAESYEGRTPFDELALQEVKFFGFPATGTG